MGHGPVSPIMHGGTAGAAVASAQTAADANAALQAAVKAKPQAADGDGGGQPSVVVAHTDFQAAV